MKINPILNDPSDLKCIKCSSADLRVLEDKIVCSECKHFYKIENNKIITASDFIKEENWETVSDGFDLFKGNEKYSAVDIIGGPRISELRSKLGVKGLSINLGSGQDNHDGFVNIDLGQYEPVDLISDLTELPLADSSVELIVSNSVLEHIYDFRKVIEEVYRVMKPNGHFYLCVPNAGCIRHHKLDYHRWTQPGLRKLFDERFEFVESGACRGIAYAIIPYVEALISYSIKNKFLLSISRWFWRLISRPLYWIKHENSEDYQALSQTLYILVKKNEV